MADRKPLSTIFDAASIPYTDHGIEGGKWVAPAAPYGIVVHHQVGFDEVGFDGALDFVKHGPIAPYYNIWHNYGDGARHIISEDEANHAGYGDPAHIDRIFAGVRVDERPDLPRSTVAKGSGAWVGNAWLYGVCLEGPDSSGGFKDVQVDAAIKTCAVLCDWYGWDPHVVVMGHKEWAAPRGRKSDPFYNMESFRTEVEEQMAQFTPEQIEGLLGLLETYPDDKRIVLHEFIDAVKQRGSSGLGYRNVIDHVRSDHSFSVDLDELAAAVAAKLTVTTKEES